VEAVERLREMRVLPLELLKLHEHEWAAMLSDAAGGGAKGHVAFDAEV